MKQQQKGFVRFSGDVTWETVSKLEETILKLTDEIKGGRLVLQISSGGGKMWPIRSFVEWVELNRVVFDTVGVGLVASAAIHLLLTGEKRSATAGSYFTLHRVRHSPSGNLTDDDLQEILDDGKLMDEAFKKELIEKTKLTKAQLDLALNHTLTLSAREALRAGLIHKILRPRRRS